MSVAVAMIPYVNMAPYRVLGPPPGCRFVPLVPKKSVAALLSGEVVAAAVPVGGLALLEGVVETLGNFGIAAKGASMSVLLFSRVSFEAFRAPCTLRVTGETASSVRLLYLLFGHLHGFDRLPRLVPDGQAPDGELLIGDRALVKGQMLSDDPKTIVTDLSERWFDIHHLPFVFARWVVRKDAPDPVKATIARWLDTFREREPELVEQAIPQAAETVALGPDVIRRYFRVIHRCLEDRDLLGQQRFCDLFEQFGRRPLFKRSAEASANGKPPIQSEASIG